MVIQQRSWGTTFFFFLALEPPLSLGYRYSSYQAREPTGHDWAAPEDLQVPVRKPHQSSPQQWSAVAPCYQLRGAHALCTLERLGGACASVHTQGAQGHMTCRVSSDQACTVRPALQLRCWHAPSPQYRTTHCYYTIEPFVRSLFHRPCLLGIIQILCMHTWYIEDINNMPLTTLLSLQILCYLCRYSAIFADSRTANCKLWGLEV